MMGMKSMMMMIMMGVVFAQPYLTDLQRLELFYNACEGDRWYNNENWMDESVSYCTWYGVTCDENDIARELRLTNNNMLGSDCVQTSGIYNGWTNLEILNLANNFIYGYFSTTLGTMSNLQELILKDCGNMDNLPTEIGTLSSLKVLDLAGMTDVRYEHGFPTEIGNLQTLTFLDLSYVAYDFYDLEPIPTYLGNLSNLQVMNISYSQYKGDFDSFNNLPNLEYLIVTGNLLPFPLPSWLNTASNLKHLDVSYTRASGSLENYLKNVPNMQYVENFNLAFNELSGTVPSTIGQMTSLKAIRFGPNNLVGQLPSEFGNLKNLEYVWGAGNHFNGTLDHWICERQILDYGFFGSQFECPLPHCCEEQDKGNTQCGYYPCILT